MATPKQKEGTKENIKKAQKARQEMSHEERTLKQPKGKKRETRAQPARANFITSKSNRRKNLKLFGHRTLAKKADLSASAGNVKTVPGTRSNGS